MKNIISCISIVLCVFLANTTIAQNLIPNWEFVNEGDIQTIYINKFNTNDGNFYGFTGSGQKKYSPTTGEQIWSRTIISYPATPWAVEQTIDNHFIAFYISRAETITVGSTIINNPDKKSIGILSKTDTAANVIWAKSFEFGPADSYASSILVGSNVSMSIDNDNNIYITSSFRGKLIIDGVEIEAEDEEWFRSKPDIFMAKFSPTGALYWLKNLGTSNDVITITDNVLSNDNKNLYITGSYRGDTLRFSSKTLLEKLINVNIYLAKLDTSGETIWIKGIKNASNNDNSNSKLMMDKKNNVLVHYVREFNSKKHTEVQKFNNAGESFLWGSFINDERDGFFGLEIDDDNYIYIGLNFEESKFKIPTRKHKFGTITPTIELTNPKSSEPDMCLLKYDSAFNLIWYKHVINKGPDKGNSLLKDNSNSIYIAGSTGNTFNGSDSSWFGNHAFYFDNKNHYFFLAKINSCIYSPLNLTKNNTLLEAPSSWKSWEWYVDGERIENANWYSYAPKKSGTYVAGTRETNGCLRITEPYTWIMTKVDDINPTNLAINVYPNPANKSFTLKTSELVDNISIYTIGGQLVKNIPTNRDGEYKIDIQNAGLYFIKVASPNGYLMEKVVIW